MSVHTTQTSIHVHTHNSHETLNCRLPRRVLWVAAPPADISWWDQTRLASWTNWTACSEVSHVLPAERSGRRGQGYGSEVVADIDILCTHPSKPPPLDDSSVHHIPSELLHTERPQSRCLVVTHDWTTRDMHVGQVKGHKANNHDTSINWCNSNIKRKIPW